MSGNFPQNSALTAKLDPMTSMSVVYQRSRRPRVVLAAKIARQAGMSQ
jgi:hypothetical protein